MNISSRCDYACRAIMELARYAESQEPLTATTIAERRRIPEKFLVHILLQLKRADLVKSIRGAQGGYLLAQSPDKLTLLDVVKAIDGPPLQPPPGGELSDELSDAWQEAGAEICKVLDSLTFRAILDEAKNPEMYFI